MPEKILITGARIVNEGKIFEGSILIKNELIHEIWENSQMPNLPAEMPHVRIIDGRGKYLLPGVIDDHVHFREPGLTQRGDIHSESKAAVAGGVTSFMDMPNTRPKATTLHQLEEKFTIAARQSLANYSFFLGATNDNIEEITKADRAKICGLKVFMGASTGNMLVDDPETLESIFTRSPLLIAVHAEEESVIRLNLEFYKAKYGENIPIQAHPLIRNEEACYRSSEKAVSLAKKHDSRLHLLHLSTVKELELLDNSIPLRDKRITGEVCAHHLWFSDKDYDSLGSLIKWNPAIKSEKDRSGLLQGLLDNRIDIIATDHAPHTWEEKQNPYLTCPSGAPLVQHSLVMMFEFYSKGMIKLEKIVDKMCHGPAILYRINRRGFIRKGYFADLVLVDPCKDWVVDSANILYKCGWSPMKGQLFHSAITHTLVNGKVVFEEGKMDEKIRGKRLVFN